MSTCCNFTAAIQATSLLDPLVVAWRTRALSNGGIPTNASIAILNTFAVGIRAQTYFSKFKTINCLVPDDFRCVMTPLIVHATDSGLWQAQTGNFPAGGNDFVKAANAQLGADGIRCDYPYAASPGTDNYNPVAIFTARDNWGVTVYQTTNDGAHGPQGVSFGVNDAATFNQGANNDGGFTALYANNGATAFSLAFSFYGYYSFNISDATTRRVFAANSVNPHALFMSSGAVFGGNLLAREFAWSGVNQNLVFAGAASNWHSFFAAHDSLTTSESADLYTRVQAMRVSFGTGFV